MYQVYHRLLIYSLKDIFVVSKFGNYQENYYKYPYASFCVDINFQFIWLRTKEFAELCGKSIFSSVRSTKLFYSIHTILQSYQ